MLTGDKDAGRIVPPSGFTARLTIFAAAVMAFLAVFVLALSLASGRLAYSWGQELARTATIRISAPTDQIQAQTDAVLGLLKTTPGVQSYRALTAEEHQALLEPWFGAGLGLDQLPMPQLVEIIEDSDGIDAADLQLRLSAEVPQAVLDDHSSWRAPLVAAASRLKLLGWFAILLIIAAIGAMVTLAANASLAANAQVISVLRQIGATDQYIAGAFIRRFTLRSLLGAVVGVLVALILILLMPDTTGTVDFLTGISFKGWHWLLPFFIPLLAASVAFFATGAAARRTLSELA